MRKITGSFIIDGKKVFLFNAKFALNDGVFTVFYDKKWVDVTTEMVTEGL